MKRKDNKGFTLLELLVVIAIIGILAVVAVPSLFKNIHKAKISEVEADYNAIRSAELAYYAENSKFITTEDDQSISDIEISDELEGVLDKTSIGGIYRITSEIDDEEGTKKLGYLDKNGNIASEYVNEINKEFSLILVLDAVATQKGWEYPQITEAQLEKLTKDIGYGKVFVDGDDTFDDGLTPIWIGLIEK